MKEFQLTDLEGVGPVTLKKLEKSGVTTPLDILIRGAKEFERITGLSPDACGKHFDTMMKLMKEEDEGIVEVTDIQSLRKLRSRQIRVPLEVDEIDEMLCGGFESQSLYEIWGEEGSGKTQLSMTAMATYLKAGHGVMMLDCEGAFDIERFDQICETRNIKYDEEKLGYHMYSDENQLVRSVQNMSSEIMESDIKLVVIDGLVGLMRLAYKGRGELGERQLELKDVLKYLKAWSLLFNCSVIITNQVTANPDPFGAKVKPIGGHVLGHYVKYIMQISKGMKNNRTVRLKKSPKSPEGDYACYINEEGISQHESLTKKILEARMKEVAVENTQGLVKKDLLLDDESEEEVTFSN